jgi:hypothetical protein
MRRTSPLPGVGNRLGFVEQAVDPSLHAVAGHQAA